MDQLRLLMDYTKFHIGVYITLLSVLVGFGEKAPNIPTWGKTAGIICFLVAGVAAGTIAGNIPLHDAWAQFDRVRFGPYRLHLLTFSSWAAIEHTAFWIGVITILVSVAVHQRKS